MDNKKVIVSIYVNPKQFNNFNDLKKYPRNLKNDLEKLEMFNNIIVYAPNDKDIYEEGEEKKKYYFGKIAQIMEGNSRPGHFEGVAHIVVFPVRNVSGALKSDEALQKVSSDHMRSHQEF